MLRAGEAQGPFLDKEAHLEKAVMRYRQLSQLWEPRDTALPNSAFSVVTQVG